MSAFLIESFYPPLLLDIALAFSTSTLPYKSGRLFHKKRKRPLRDPFLDLQLSIFISFSPIALAHHFQHILDLKAHRLYICYNGLWKMFPISPNVPGVAKNIQFFLGFSMNTICFIAFYNKLKK
jgi:hypothetical protein